MPDCPVPTCFYVHHPKGHPHVVSSARCAFCGARAICGPDGRIAWVVAWPPKQCDHETIDGRT